MSISEVLERCLEKPQGLWTQSDKNRAARCLRFLGWEPGSLPETERAASENLALPMWAGIAEQTQERVVSVVRDSVAVGAAR